MANYLRELLYIIFPPTCYHCDDILVGDERYFCLNCQLNFPFTDNASYPDNETEMRLAGRVPVVSGASLFYYQKGMVSKDILHNIKYFGHYKMAFDFGAILGSQMAESGRFDDVDYLVPVPLHWFKKYQRGYNQSELLCKGISKKFKRPICTNVLYRSRYTRTQTHKNHEQRLQNMKGVFKVRHIKKLEGKHILLVDDVITSGATTESCWNALKDIPGIRISIASLAITSNH